MGCRKNITQAALKDSVVILNKKIPDILPNDPRTILNTPRQVHIKSTKAKTSIL